MSTNGIFGVPNVSARCRDACPLTMKFEDHVSGGLPPYALQPMQLTRRVKQNGRAGDCSAQSSDRAADKNDCYVMFVGVCFVANRWCENRKVGVKLLQPVRLDLEELSVDAFAGLNCGQFVSIPENQLSRRAVEVRFGSVVSPFEHRVLERR